MTKWRKKDENDEFALFRKMLHHFNRALHCFLENLLSLSEKIYFVG